MKRTVFTAVGLVAMTFIACNTSTKENKAQEVAQPEVIESVVEETTTQFEEKAMEDCVAYARILNDIKLMEATEAQRREDSLAAAEKALKEALAKTEALKRKRASTPEALAKRAKEAEAWFEANYGEIVEAYAPKYKGLRVKMATDGEIYKVEMLVNGKWKKDQELLNRLTKIKVEKELAEGNAVSITVKNV